MSLSVRLPYQVEYLQGGHPYGGHSTYSTLDRAIDSIEIWIECSPDPAADLRAVVYHDRVVVAVLISAGPKAPRPVVRAL